MAATRVDVTATFLPDQLSEQDACDKCGSQAYVRVTLSSGQLLFCAHHYQQYEAELVPIAIAVFDDRDRLRAEASRGPADLATSP